MAKRLTEHHPFMKKVNKLCEIMDEMGIRIDYDRMGSLNVVDTESGESYKLKDNDTGEKLSEFPYFAEFKLVTLD